MKTNNYDHIRSDAYTISRILSMDDDFLKNEYRRVIENMKQYVSAIIWPETLLFVPKKNKKRTLYRVCRDQKSISIDVIQYVHVAYIAYERGCKPTNIKTIKNAINLIELYHYICLVDDGFDNYGTNKNIRLGGSWLDQFEEGTMFFTDINDAMKWSNFLLERISK